METRRARFFVTIATIVLTLCSGALNAASTASQSSTPQEVFDKMRGSFRVDQAKGVQARYQWQLSGPQGGEWCIEVHDGTFKMRRGRIDNPDVTFVASDKTWVALSNRTLGGVWAYLTGRLKIRGDKGLAKKLGQMFP